MRRCAVLLALSSIGARCEVERPYPPPTAAELRAHIDGLAAGARSMRGEARIEFDDGRHRVKATVMLLAADDAVRFDVLSPVGTTLQIFAAQGARYALLDLEKSRYEQGDAAGCGVRFFPAALSVGEVSRVLRGGTPLLPGDDAVAWDGSEEAEVLRVRGADGRTQEVRVRGDRGRWRWASNEIRDADGRSALRIDRGGDGSLRFASTARRTVLAVRFRSAERNVIVPDGAFRIDPPPGTTVVEDPVCEPVLE